MRVSLFLAVGVLMAFAVARAGSASTPELTLADPAMYHLLTPDCWEPDVINSLDTPVQFAVQARTGNGRVSETVLTEVLAPGERAHLHIFADTWTAGHMALTALIGEVQQHGCELTIWLA